MSQKTVTQIVERTCDGDCGKVQKWDLAAPGTQEMLVEMTDWYMITRQFPDGSVGRMQACSLECIPTAAVKLALPPQQPEEPPIDLSTLRAGGEGVKWN